MERQRQQAAYGNMQPSVFYTSRSNWEWACKAAKALGPKPDPANRFRIKETTPKGPLGLRTVAIEDIRTI